MNWAFPAHDDAGEIRWIWGEVCCQGRKGWARRDVFIPLGATEGICETYLRISISLSSQNKKQGLLASDRGVERVQA